MYNILHSFVWNKNLRIIKVLVKNIDPNFSLYDVRSNFKMKKVQGRDQ